MAPANSTAKPVMRSPPESAGVAGIAFGAVTVDGAGAAPLSTNQVTVAEVAPLGQARPVATKPPKVTLESSRALDAGCVTVMVVSGPFEMLRPVRIAVVLVPAAMRALVNE